MNEKQRQQMETIMKNLHVSQEEAEEIMAFDKEVDRMTSLKQINSDLTEDQQKALKKMKNGTGRAIATKPVKREKKANVAKKDIISNLTGAVMAQGATDLNITNDEREFTFMMNGVKYKVVLSAPRS